MKLSLEALTPTLQLLQDQFELLIFSFDVRILFCLLKLEFFRQDLELFLFEGFFSSDLGLFSLGQLVGFLSYCLLNLGLLCLEGFDLLLSRGTVDRLFLGLKRFDLLLQLALLALHDHELSVDLLEVPLKGSCLVLDISLDRVILIP
jgi:hypothetical protein